MINLVQARRDVGPVFNLNGTITIDTHDTRSFQKDSFLLFVDGTTVLGGGQITESIPGRVTFMPLHNGLVEPLALI